MVNSGTECSIETIQYRLNLPSALHSISPALSALHVSRATLLHPEASAILHPSHCLHCGTYYFSDDHSTHLIGPSTKKKRKRATSSHAKPLWRSCYLCGFSVDTRTSPSLNHSIQLPSGSFLKSETVPTTPQTKEIDQESLPTNIPRPVATTVPTTTCLPVPPLIGRQSQPKPSHTKASALRDMLSRDRERQEAVKAHKGREGREGLAAFLKGL